MNKQTAIDESQIRVSSVIIEEIAHEINNRAKVLCEKFDELYPNLQFTDPVKDVAFNRYMITMAHVKMLCDQIPSLAHQAREMQSFGKQPAAADVSHLNRLTPVLPGEAQEAKQGAGLATVTA